ncbi:PEP/pyruvate-binding domain-containing protein [Marinobacter sp. CHS3-4]|uniref:PEP/pyruvate-binding domain-containing protein n=1 Tax=Marinobacter sp. CHS3-4 TaxID=3045174 RepID=UPI0024B59230|nr:PEP/pyruvate-binding domain-containing protein [Marinobacter sp. CHS3-4]MDI9244616.1 PEP/pyruvate-binding domain-containing protein [Marinobacter sp. CHS3-4]
MKPAPLASACDESVYGGKATQLGAALRAGLPVPEGFALDTRFVDAIAAGNASARTELARLCSQMTGPVAVRSSAIGEDSVSASFAGQHATVLNLMGFEAVSEAIMIVWESARTKSAQAYRERVGADTAICMGVVIQRLVAADVAGVLFTCNPVTGQDELVVEASWGLGEAVVQGLVIPDSYRMDRAGRLIESRAGFKDTCVQRVPGGLTRTEAVAAHLVEQLCLDAKKLAALHGLVTQCEGVFGTGPHDIEWAFEGDALYLLQLRPVTKSAAA